MDAIVSGTIAAFCCVMASRFFTEELTRVFASALRNGDDLGRRRTDESYSDFSCPTPFRAWPALKASCLSLFMRRKIAGKLFNNVIVEPRPLSHQMCMLLERLEEAERAACELQPERKLRFRA